MASGIPRPFEVGRSSATMLGIKMIPLTDSWARRRFTICFREFDGLQPAAQRTVDHLAQRAADAEERV